MNFNVIYFIRIIIYCYVKSFYVLNFNNFSMYCEKCGNLVDDNARFCPKCGENLNKNVETTKVESSNKAKYPPENYLIWAILSTLFCCWPVGIASIVYASKVDSAFNRGDYEGALEASKNAKKWAWISAISAIVFWVLYCLLIVIAVAMGVDLD